MTQRVLCQKQEQEEKGRISDLERASSSTQAQQRGFKPEHGGAWSTVPHRNQTPSAATQGFQPSPFGVLTSSPPLPGKHQRMTAQSEQITEDPPASQRQSMGSKASEANLALANRKKPATKAQTAGVAAGVHK